YIEKLTKNTRYDDILLDYAELLDHIDVDHENIHDDDDANDDTEESDNREGDISNDTFQRIENIKKRTMSNQSKRRTPDTLLVNHILISFESTNCDQAIWIAVRIGQKLTMVRTLSILIFLLLLCYKHLVLSYNPIPTGAVIITTNSTIFVLRPIEYNGTDMLTPVFTTNGSYLIVNTVFDSSARYLYILYVQNDIYYIGQLVGYQQISNIYVLAYSWLNNNISSFTSDINNRRIFAASTNDIYVFSMGGLMYSNVGTDFKTLQSIYYDSNDNRFYVLTSTTISTCYQSGVNNTLTCPCSISLSSNFRYVTADPNNNAIIYLVQEPNRLNTASINAAGCPLVLLSESTVDQYSISYIAVDGNNIFSVASTSQMETYTTLLIGSFSSPAKRNVSVDQIILAIQLSPPLQQTVQTVEECFRGITYYDYRVAVCLAAIFGTIMGILLCFNSLFLIDTLMTKRIIRDLKKQIPKDLVEDRWNKLVEEKYAKVALELHRNKQANIPPPKPRFEDKDNNAESGGGDKSRLSVSNVTNYIRRKSGDLIGRRKSRDQSIQPPQTTIHETGNEDSEYKMKYNLS
ncbi:unnamed protein product, partial [Didymodactylos carnosus]